MAGKRAKIAEERHRTPAPNSARAVPLELAGYVERLGAAHVAELLRVGVDDLPALLEGRATLSRKRFRELRQAVARGPVATEQP